MKRKEEVQSGAGPGPAGPDHRRRVYDDITQLIASPQNPTPLVRLNTVSSSPDFRLYLKMERYNPFGSVKDRIAYQMLAALDRGDRTVAEPSSGNTGIALTCVANALGIPIEIVVPEKIPEEKKVMLRFLGARVTEADDALCPLYPGEGARGVVNALIKSPATRDGYISPNQYENNLNVEAHYRTTGPEIWQQTGGKVTHFFAGFGTCGTITGVGRYLKERNPDIKVIGVEPASAEHKLPGMKRISGLAEEYVPSILDKSVIDDTVAVSDRDAYRAALDLARKEGIPVGPTTGAILVAASSLGSAARGLAVVISPDDAFKYASFYRDILESAPRLIADEVDLCDLICPASKMKAAEIIESLEEGETVSLVLGDTETLKSVAQELKARGLRSDFERRDGDRFVLTVTR